MIKLLGFACGTVISAVVLLTAIDGTRMRDHETAVSPAMVKLPIQADGGGDTTKRQREEADAAAALPVSVVPEDNAGAGPDSLAAQAAATAPGEEAVSVTAGQSRHGQGEAARAHGANQDLKEVQVTASGESDAGQQSACADKDCVAKGSWAGLWRPFRSELSAQGFATGLARATGLDYRVLRTDDGQFQVAFRYVDDDERRTRLARIEAATGLHVSEASR